MEYAVSVIHGLQRAVVAIAVSFVASVGKDGFGEPPVIIVVETDAGAIGIEESGNPALLVVAAFEMIFLAFGRGNAHTAGASIARITVGCVGVYLVELVESCSGGVYITNLFGATAQAIVCIGEVLASLAVAEIDFEALAGAVESDIVYAYNACLIFAILFTGEQCHIADNRITFPQAFGDNVTVEIVG